MPLTRLTPLEGDAILSLEDAKEHLRVDGDEDAVIAMYRDAAIAHIERISGVILAPAEFRWTVTALIGAIDLPIRPVTDILEIEHYDSNGALVAYDGGRLMEGQVIPAAGTGWPVAHGFASIRFAAGLATPAIAPDLLAAVKLMLGHFYANREAVSGTMHQVPLGVAALVHPYQAALG